MNGSSILKSFGISLLVVAAILSGYAVFVYSSINDDMSARYNSDKYQLIVNMLSAVAILVGVGSSLIHSGKFRTCKFAEKFISSITAPPSNMSSVAAKWLTFGYVFGPFVSLFLVQIVMAYLNWPRIEPTLGVSIFSLPVLLGCICLWLRAGLKGRSVLVLLPYATVSFVGNMALGIVTAVVLGAPK